MSTSQTEAKGLLSGLFDFGFTTFITLKFLRIIYAILMALIFLGALVFFLRLVSQGGASALLAFVLVPIGTLLYLLFARVSLEVVAVLFRIGENTSIMVAQGRGGAPGQQYGTPPTGYGPPSGPVPPSAPYGTPPTA